MFDSEISQAWSEVAAVLGIRVHAPYALCLPDGCEVEAFLPDFAGPLEVIALADGDHERLRKVVASARHVSRLGPSSRVFDRQHFSETLGNWGPHGPAAD